MFVDSTVFLADTQARLSPGFLFAFLAKSELLNFPKSAHIAS